MTYVVLGIDPGRVSGWAIAVDGEGLHSHGVATKAEHRTAAIHQAESVASFYAVPLHVCMEWVQAGGGGSKTAMGIGQARGRWLEALELSGYSERRVIRATTAQWRKATHGLVKAAGATRDERTQAFKAAAMAYMGIDRPDAAEAACIALYGARLLEEKAA